MLTKKIFSSWSTSFLLFFVVIWPTDFAQAKVFRNSYVSFELPNRWDCFLENNAWICRYAISKKCLGVNSASKSCGQQRKKTKEAVIILAAKEVGPKDSLKTYYDHLKKARPVVLKGGKRTTSKIIHVKQSSIQKHTWIDGMHLSSEIPHYYTRYLATVKANIAVLVTFSAHKMHYTKYSSEFFKAIKSMRVLATKSQINRKEIQRSSEQGILGGGGPVFDIDPGEYDEVDTMGSGSSSSFETYLLLAAAFLALLGGIVWFRGRK